MKHAISRTLWPFFLFAVVFLIPFSTPRAGEQPASFDEQCNIHQGSCSKEIGDCTITLNIAPKPVKAMEELTFTVTLRGNCSSGVPVIDLSMPGMVMGENKVLLKKVSDGVFQGTGVIVRCPSGRKTWQATIIVPDHGTVDFVFDVIY